MQDVLIAVWVFLAYMAIDALYALYTLAVTRLHSVRAATISAAIYLLLASGLLAFVRSAWYLLPAAAGGWLGTFLTVQREKRKAARGEA